MRLFYPVGADRVKEKKFYSTFFCSFVFLLQRIATKSVFKMVWNIKALGFKFGGIIVKYVKGIGGGKHPFLVFDLILYSFY